MSARRALARPWSRVAPGLAALALLPALGCHPAERAPAPPADAPRGATAGASAVSVPQILASSDLPPTLDAPLPDDDMKVTVHRLRNGLTVYISTDRQKPRFSGWIAVRTGSRNDPADSTGLAHYLEHMLFKGTDDYGTTDMGKEAPHLETIAALYDKLRSTTDADTRAKIFAQIDAETQAAAAFAIPNEFDRTYSALGIEGLNAFTDHEVTSYIADVPANRLEAWARVEAERFADPVFRLFLPELEAVYEEKNLSLDSPYRRVNEAMMAALFPEHPYGTQPTIGRVEHLKNPAYGDMVAYFERWYAPNNMAVLLAGDIDPKTALPVLERTLGAWEPRPLPRRREAPLPPVQGRVVRRVVTEGAQTVTLAWRTVPANHPDAPVLQVLDALLDNARTGLLNTQLELTQAVPNAGSWHQELPDAGYFVTHARLKEGQTHDQVEALLLGVIADLKAGKFTDAQIDAIKLHLDIQEKRRLESNRGRVSRMLGAFIERRAWRDEVARKARLRSVTKADLLRVAQAYLGPDFVAIQRHQGTPTLPKIDKPKISPVAIDTDRRSPFAAEILALPAQPLEPEWLKEGTHYERATLPAGPMIAAPNPRNDLFDLSYHFERGQRQSRLLCLALDLLEQSGAGGTSAEDLRAQFYALGTSVHASCGADESSIQLSGVDRNLEASVELLDRWLREVTIDEDVLRKRVDSLLSTRRDQLDSSSALAGALSATARFGRKSAWLTYPSNAAVRRATAKKLRSLLTSFPDYEHRTLYFGPRPAQEAAQVVALGKRHRKVRPRAPERFRRQSGARVYFLHRDVAKSEVGVSIPVGVRPRDDRPAARLLGHYLGGGMASLIFQEIREARGLAYRAYGYVIRGERPGDEWSLRGGMGTQADKTVEALSTYLDLVLRRPLDEQRLAEARATLDEEYRTSRVDPRWVTYWVRSWDLAGEPEDPRPWEWAQIQKLTTADLQAFAARFAQRPIIISVVGDREKVDLGALKKVAPVTQMKADALFSYGPFPSTPAPATADAR